MKPDDSGNLLPTQTLKDEMVVLNQELNSQLNELKHLHKKQCDVYKRIQDIHQSLAGLRKSMLVFINSGLGSLPR